MVKIFRERIGDPKDDDNDDDSGSDPRLENLSQEQEELRDAIVRIVEDAKAHEHVDEIPDEKEEALRVLGNTFLALDFPYGSGNGYNRVRFANIDEALTWFLLTKELGVKPVRKPADQLSGSPFSIEFHKEDYGFFDDCDGYGFRVTVYCACHDEEGKFIGRRKGTTDRYPTMFRASIAAIDVARKIKQDWFSVAGE